ncbi:MULTISPECIES: hypothetical protein [Burkholderia]|uniref:hypothetical protein n=1 Tax=Burkholderia TaxID=32008 RepID=UPI00207C5B05|nr:MULTISPECIES: hypothetical protein [Burkholderia]MDC6086376.1 hypothetical protein [Burkholderia cenocepacia]MDN7835298.1 hypothetical protein [Burkholderia contaminans]MDN7965209.1 hypothetical protein [Burkholderia multivorans]MDN8051299.1 hypothetical protein [Burkholderia multivorans]
MAFLEWTPAGRLRHPSFAGCAPTSRHAQLPAKIRPARRAQATANKWTQAGPHVGGYLRTFCNVYMLWHMPSQLNWSRPYANP